MLFRSEREKRGPAARIEPAGKISGRMSSKKKRKKSAGTKRRIETPVRMIRPPASPLGRSVVTHAVGSAKPAGLAPAPTAHPAGALTRPREEREDKVVAGRSGPTAQQSARISGATPSGCAGAPPRRLQTREEFCSAPPAGRKEEKGRCKTPRRLAGRA